VSTACGFRVVWVRMMADCRVEGHDKVHAPRARRPTVTRLSKEQKSAVRATTTHVNPTRSGSGQAQRGAQAARISPRVVD
jgi:hypothetical protein